MNKSQFSQAKFDAIAPDAIVYIDGKRTILLKGFDNGEISNVEVDFMMFVNSISTSKGIESVPGQATISVKAPTHMFNNFYGSLKEALSTMLEIEIYMTGRFLFNGEQQYYPVFWGIISNLSESTSAGEFVSVTITCQDMMRWLQITKIDMAPTAYNSGVKFDISAQMTEAAKKEMIAFSSIFVSLSTPGIINALLSLSISDGFLELNNISDRDVAFTKALNIIDQNKSTDNNKIDTLRSVSDQIIKNWNEKFKEFSSALYIYAYKGFGPVKETKLTDVLVDLNQYKYIYGKKDIITSTGETIEQPWLDISKIYPYGAESFNTAEPQAFEPNLMNRLDVANEVKNQLHFEFFQDVDGTIVLKPPFYNMDTRDNIIYVLEDIDIDNINIIDDESNVVTRLDVTGTITNGMPAGTGANPNYGFAIDKDLLEKYGLRTECISTNFITSSDEAFMYAHRELSKRNSLRSNASISMQGRPELKLGYPVFIKSKNMFGYLQTIDHDFTFGESFSSRLSLVALRTTKVDSLGNTLKNLLIEVTGTPSNQVDIKGKDFVHNKDNPYNEVTRLCDPTASQKFKVDRPDYRFKYLDDILKYQGTFRYIHNENKQWYDPREYQQVTDNNGFELIGNGYPFAKDLKLTENFKIVVRSSEKDATAAEIASSMQLMTKNGQQSSIRFQQPLTLNQISDVSLISNRSKFVIANDMTLSDKSNEVAKLQPKH